MAHDFDFFKFSSSPRMKPLVYKITVGPLSKQRHSATATALQHCSAALRQDREVVDAAVSQAPAALEFAHEDLRGSRETARRWSTESLLSEARTWDFLHTRMQT